MEQSEMLRICRDEAHYLVFRRRVPLDVEDLVQDAVVIALEKYSTSPALLRRIVQCGLRNKVRHYRSRPGGVRYSGGARGAPLPSEGKTADASGSFVPEQLRVRQDEEPLGLVLAQIFARRALETGGQAWDSSAFLKASSAARHERMKAVATWYRKNHRRFDII